MNDLERDLRELLDEDARRVSTPVAAPEGLRRSARRRQVLFGGAVGVAAIAIVAGVVTGASLLLPLRVDGQPAVEGPKTTGTMNGITITYPQSWQLIDPDTAGLNGSPMMGESPLPRIVLALAPTEAPETFGCPARAAQGDAASLLMTIQEEPLALDGPASTPWPAELRPMSVDTSEAGCYLDWEFLRAGWTASNRTFEARVGFSPDATDDDRAALEDAFVSMTFASSDQGVTSVVLGTGIAGDQPWSLFAQRSDQGLDLTLEAGSTGAGAHFSSPATNNLQPSSTVLGEGPTRQLVVFGAIPTDVVRIEGTSPDGSIVPGRIFDVPDDVDSGSNAFAIFCPPGRSELRGYDDAGNVVARGSVGRGEAPSATGSS